MDSKVRFLFKPQLKNPVLIAGLPGVGQIGKLASDFLIQQLSAKKFAEQLSPYFPHYATLDRSGMLRPTCHEFFYANHSRRDLIILTGEYPLTSCEGHYKVAIEILNAMEKVGVREIYTIGGYIPTSGKEKGEVVIMPNTEVLSRLSSGIEVEVGPVIGLTGLLVSLAGLRGIKGAILLAEAGDPLVDSRSAKKVLQTLCGILDLKLNLSDLDRQAEVLREWVERLKKEIRKREAPPAKEETWYIS